MGNIVKRISGLSVLPKFQEPKSLNEALSNIEGLGSNMSEHAYLVGCNLIWIKEQLEHGEFIPWIEKNVWFTERTAQKFINYTKHCKLSNSLMKYPIEANTNNIRISNEPAEILPGQYRTIIIDPPWPYGTQYNKETRRVGQQYAEGEMSLDAISATEFPFADDCVLWLWATHKFLPISFEIIQDWGFDYKATLVWDKQIIGMGYWLRMQCEFCLLAIKGNPQWQNTETRDVISETRREHSRKPEEFYKTILDICPHPIGEAFSRQKRKGIQTITRSVETNKFNGLEQ